MTLTFSLDQNDYLQEQLFSASKTSRIKKQRLRVWMIVSWSMVVLGVLFYQNKNMFLTYYFLALGIISFLFYPAYQRWHDKNHYAKFIADNYKYRFGQTTHAEFTEFAIECTDITGGSTINLTAIKNITETADYFYPKLKTGETIIIPKSKIDAVSELRMELKQICSRFSIDFIEDLNWKWK